MGVLDYHSASTIDEVVRELAEYGDKAKILSGGTDLLVQLREGRLQAEVLVDIKSLPEANELVYDPEIGLQLGAAVTCARLCRDPVFAEMYPGLFDAISLIGGTQIQNRASLGGNLCNASPAADAIPALIVHHAICIVFGSEGKRLVRVEEFCTAPGKTVLRRGEFLLSILIPPPEPGFGAAYTRFTPRNEMDIAVVGVGASVVLQESSRYFRSAEVALGAVAPTPLYVQAVGGALKGREVTREVISEAACLAGEAAQPIDDMRGTVAQRVHLSVVLARRVLEKAVERAIAKADKGAGR